MSSNPQVYETTFDSYPYFFRLDRIEDRPEGRVMVGVVRAGGITKGTDHAQEITEGNWRREFWRPTNKQVPGW